MLQPTAAVYRVKQVHGGTVLSPSEIEETVSPPIASSNDADSENSPSFPNADGLVTEQANQSVWVCTADCTPVLIADAETGQVAAIHAGWRGTAAEIVPKAVARLQSQGSRLPNLRIAMGPAIAGEVYQVSADVAAQVGATVIYPSEATESDPIPEAIEPPDFILDILSQLPDSPVLDDAEPGRARLDVRRVNALQLEQLGIDPDQIAIAPYCTYQNAEHFFSYRRERQKKVQWSGIVSG